MRPRALLFDWDNTLIDAWAGIAAALNKTFAAFDLPPWTVAETRSRVRVSFRESFPVLFGAAHWEAARDRFLEAMQADHLQHLDVLPGVDALLDAAAGWPRAIVSNKHGPLLREEVAALGWDKHFHIAVGAGDASADKPDPAPIQLALARLNLPAGADIWYIGDTALDMQTARAACVLAVLLGDAAHDGGVDRAAPDLHFSTADALSTRLRGLA